VTREWIGFFTPDWGTPASRAPLQLERDLVTAREAAAVAAEICFRRCSADSRQPHSGRIVSANSRTLQFAYDLRLEVRRQFVPLPVRNCSRRRSGSTEWAGSYKCRGLRIALDAVDMLDTFGGAHAAADGHRLRQRLGHGPRFLFLGSPHRWAICEHSNCATSMLRKKPHTIHLREIPNSVTILHGRDPFEGRSLQVMRTRRQLLLLVLPAGSRSLVPASSRISRHAVKSRCAHKWNGWGRLSDDGLGQKNPDSSDGAEGHPPLHGGARSSQRPGSARDYRDHSICTRERRKPGVDPCMPGAGLSDRGTGKALSG
jgi:hypothetical protein